MEQARLGYEADVRKGQAVTYDERTIGRQRSIDRR